MFENIIFGFCRWDIVAAFALVAVGIAVMLQYKRHKKHITELLSKTDSEKC